MMRLNAIIIIIIKDKYGYLNWLLKNKIELL